MKIYVAKDSSSRILGIYKDQDEALEQASWAARDEARRCTFDDTWENHEMEVKRESLRDAVEIEVTYDHETIGYAVVVEEVAK